MLALLAGLSIAFVVFHFVPSHPPVRDALVRRLGVGSYLGLYSIVNLAVFVPLVYLWITTRLYEPALYVVRDPALTGIVQLVQLFGMALIGAGVIDATSNSITTHHGNLTEATIEVKGIAAVSRHPLSLGSALLSAGHLVVNGWPADLWFWGSLFGLSTLGALHQDLRQRRQPQYAEFQSQTTFLPNPLGVQHLTARSWGGLLFGVAAGLVIRWAHPWFT